MDGLQPSAQVQELKLRCTLQYDLWKLKDVGHPGGKGIKPTKADFWPKRWCILPIPILPKGHESRITGLWSGQNAMFGYLGGIRSLQQSTLRSILWEDGVRSRPSMDSTGWRIEVPTGSVF